MPRGEAVWYRWISVCVDQMESYVVLLYERVVCYIMRS